MSYQSFGSDGIYEPYSTTVLKRIVNNPYRIFGVLSNSPLRERIASQNRLNAFAKVGKTVSLPYDYNAIITQVPDRSNDSLLTANAALNLDKDRLKNALFWFISISPLDEIALKYLQSGNLAKAKEIFLKKETTSSLINMSILAFIEGDVQTGYNNIAKVIHTKPYRDELLTALDVANLDISEDELAELYITELLSEVKVKELLSAATNSTDRRIIGRLALDGPISKINSAISIAKQADAHNAEASLAAGKKLMTSTKAPLKEVRDIVGSADSQYQMVADNVAKQVLQCGINYYNNAPESDVESPRKAMELQEYALNLAVGQLTKDRCRDNYNTLKKAVDNMPPAVVAIEARRVKEELRKFCALPDKISHSVALLNNTKPLLQTIKAKLGVNNAFYLSLSTQVVGNALHNVIEEVNQAQNYLMAIIKAIKDTGIDPRLLNSIGDEHSPVKVLDSKVKPVMREAWKTTLLMDSFDMESEFRSKRYNPNRQSLKEMCDSLNIPTQVSTPHTPYRPKPATTPVSPTTSGDEGLPPGCWAAIIVAIVIFLGIVL